MLIVKSIHHESDGDADDEYDDEKSGEFTKQIQQITINILYYVNLIYVFIHVLQFRHIT